MEALTGKAVWAVLCALPLLLTACVATPVATGDDSSSQREFPLSSLDTSTLSVRENTFRVWLATTDEQRSEGLMYVNENEIADDQGMLFVFPQERLLGFWMKNTVTSLDIAFARSDGTIVAIHTMPPLTLQTFSSFEPAMFAFEVKSGRFAALGVREGDRLIIPPDVFEN